MMAVPSEPSRNMNYQNTRPPSTSRKINTGEPIMGIAPDQASDPVKQGGCIYEKRYFAKLDECLARKPYPTIGLPAFKNEDMLVRRGLTEKHGCVFVLNSGLFKNYQLAKYSVDSDSQCLDGNKVSLSMTFANISLSYLWTLRCLNRADQLLDDATMDGKTAELAKQGQPNGICVGSSQNFGFTTLQLSGIEALMDLATDVYKNWRITNVTVAMANPTPIPQSTSRTFNNINGSVGAQPNPPVEHNLDSPEWLPGAHIRDFVFESLDGDELNWRYLHLYQNWARNRLHANFLEQYRRFLWISLQRCLAESSERLPVKLVDVFASPKYN